jgi:hypothetical protein
MDVWHGIRRRYPVSEYLSPEGCDELVEEIGEIARELVASAEIVWDGNNNVGVVDPEVSELLGKALENYLTPEDGEADNRFVTVWEAVNWYGAGGITLEQACEDVGADPYGDPGEIAEQLSPVGDQNEVVVNVEDWVEAEQANLPPMNDTIKKHVPHDGFAFFWIATEYGYMCSFNEDFEDVWFSDDLETDTPIEGPDAETIAGLVTGIRAARRWRGREEYEEKKRRFSK